MLHLQATDRDDGVFGDVTYTLSGFGASSVYVCNFNILWIPLYMTDTLSLACHDVNILTPCG